MDVNWEIVAQKLRAESERHWHNFCAADGNSTSVLLRHAVAHDILGSLATAIMTGINPDKAD